MIVFVRVFLCDDSLRIENLNLDGREQCFEQLQKLRVRVEEFRLGSPKLVLASQ